MFMWFWTISSLGAPVNKILSKKENKREEKRKWFIYTFFLPPIVYIYMIIKVMAKVLKLKENSLSEKNESVKNWSRSINWLTLVLRPVWWSEPGKDSTFSKTNALGRTSLNVGPSGHPTHDLLIINGCKINQNHQNSWVFRQWVETTKINAVIKVYTRSRYS